MSHSILSYGANAQSKTSAILASNLLGGGLIMGAFCVFGISRTLCKAAAARKTPEHEGKRSLSLEEWAARRDVAAEQLFADSTRRVKISPELDAPQFCYDWLATNPGHVRDTVLMVRGPKLDKHGNEVKKDGAVVETWLPYEAECARRNIAPYVFEVAP